MRARALSGSLRSPQVPISVLVQAVRLPRVETVLPCSLQPDHVVGVHIRRHPLQDAESEVSGITLAEQAIPPVPRGCVVQPSAEEVVATVSGPHVAASPQ